MALGLSSNADGIRTRQMAAPATGPAPDSAGPTGTVALSNVSGADDLKAIEALTGTSGLLAKTAANTWALRTLTLSTEADAFLALTNAAGVAADPLLDLDTQSANRVFAGPTSGGAAKPAFRALVSADIPDLSATYQPLDADLTAIAALTTTTMGRGVLALTNTANRLFGSDGSSAAALVSVSANLSLASSTLDTVQGIQTSSTPQFARQGLGIAAHSTILLRMAGQSTQATPAGSTGMLLGGADAANTLFQMEAYGAINQFLCRRAGGTAGSPSNLATNDTIFTFAGTGYGNSAYQGTKVAFDLLAAEAWTTTFGTLMTFRTTLIGGTTVAERFRITGLGHLKATGAICLGAYTVANLPTGIDAYSFAFVTDATLTAITGLGLAPTGGGANKVPVYTTDGTNWLML